MKDFFSTIADFFKRYLCDVGAWYTYLIWAILLLILLIPLAVLVIKHWETVKNWKLVAKGLDFLKWLWKECRDWKTLVLLLIVCLVLSSPVWVCYILGFLFDWTWAIVVATAVWAFWWLPGMPFFALAVTITLGIRKISEAYREGKLHRRESKRVERAEKRRKNQGK